MKSTRRAAAKLPTVYTILFGITAIIAILTWLIPAGRYDYLTADTQQRVSAVDSVDYRGGRASTSNSWYIHRITDFATRCDGCFHGADQRISQSSRRGTIRARDRRVPGNHDENWRHECWRSRCCDPGYPGGQEFFTSPEGGYAMVHHAWTAGEEGYTRGSRRLHVRPIRFEGDRPVIGAVNEPFLTSGDPRNDEQGSGQPTGSPVPTAKELKRIKEIANQIVNKATDARLRVGQFSLVSRYGQCRWVDIKVDVATCLCSDHK